MIACASCDLLHRLPSLRAGEKAYCTRCGSLLHRASQSPIQGTLALVLAAAMLLALANGFPFLRFALEGQVQENRIVTGVVALWSAGQPGLASLILFTTVIAPALQIGVLIYVLLPLSLRRRPPGIAAVLRLQEALGSWAMLDVYMLALLVTLVKLGQMAQVTLELGAYCFAGLFAVLVGVGALYDRRALWQRLEELS